MLTTRKNPLAACAALLAGLLLQTAVFAAQPLKVFIRTGEENRGEEVHAHPRVARSLQELFTDRGMAVKVDTKWPTAAEAKEADVIVAYAQDGGDATKEEEKVLEAFAAKGGGLVIIHTAAVSKTNETWWRDLIGGAWKDGHTKWYEGDVDFYFTENQFVQNAHPVTAGASNFRIDDEIYYDLDMLPEARILATSYTPNVSEGKKPAEGGKPHIYDIQPQVWAYERTFPGGAKPYRAFVSLPGHKFGTFEHSGYRALLLRGIAWAAGRENVDEFVKPEELVALRYPVGGPQQPEETLANLEIDSDFELKLIAAEPLITKPMNVDWDPSGRLWVAETPEYPNGRRGMRPDYRGREWKDHGGIDPRPGEQDRPGRDSISILTDSNGDGVMDKKDVFYTGLDLVTGFVFHKDGVIVTQAPDILFIRDTDGDGKADKVETLYSGLGIGDTHAVINNPRWGWDGWIYATHGYSGSDKVKNAKGEAMPAIGSGVIRFRPDGSVIEQYSSKGGNTWGLQITDDNRVMWTQPTSGQLLMETVLPEFALARGAMPDTASFHVVEPSGKAFPLLTWEQMAYVQIDWVGSFTAAAGAVIYDGGSWPQEYNGDYLTTEPTINIVHHTRLTPEGVSSTFHRLPGKEETELIRSRDMWWRPIEVRVGPDGAVYVLDFYNQAVIHNDTRGPDHNKVNAAVRPDRDHYFGRIWRLQHKGGKKIEIPNLQGADVKKLAAALENPNRHTRMTASRLLVEALQGKSSVDIVAALSKDAGPEARMAADWTTFNILGSVKNQIESGLTSENARVRRNACLVLEELALRSGSSNSPANIAPLLGDADAGVRLAALRALGAGGASEETIAAIVASWATFEDKWQQSAALGVLSSNPPVALTAAIEAGDASLQPVIIRLAEALAASGDTKAAALTVLALADEPSQADGMKRLVIDILAKNLQQAPEMTPELTQAFEKLLASGASGSVLPLAAKWDASGTLKEKIASLIGTLQTRLVDAKSSDQDRLAAASGLLGLRESNPDLLAQVRAVFSPKNSAELNSGLVHVLADAGDPGLVKSLTDSWTELDDATRSAGFEAALTRAEWSSEFLDTIKAGKVDPTKLGPANIARLRAHPDAGVASKAAGMIEVLNPMAGKKNEIIANLLKEVDQPGDPEKGKLAFNGTCAVCHKYNGFGQDIGPGLTGMGTHAASELLSAIVDPNREIDPSFVSWNFQMKDGSFNAGVIARENNASVLVKSLIGAKELKTADIKTRVNSGLSLMPEGFEALGPEMLRDIISYMRQVDGGKFRTLDLKTAYTANTGGGLFRGREFKEETLLFTKEGTINVEGIPFNVVGPEKAAGANNIIVLEGGPQGTFCRSMPKRVEIPVGFEMNRLHILGGVSGWGHIGPGSDSTQVMSILVHFEDGDSQNIDLFNGREFSDYIRPIEVPGSKLAQGLAKQGHQVRYFHKDLKKTGVVTKIELVSTAGGASPVTVAVTAEKVDESELKAAAAKPAPKPEVTKELGPVDDIPAGTEVVLFGGGSSHDFRQFFAEEDLEILSKAGIKAAYTGAPDKLTPALDAAKTLIFSANQELKDPALRAKLLAFPDAKAKRGLILLHAGVWYNWGDWPEWNKDIVGGGSRGHDPLGEFTVKVVKPDHPLMAGVPAEFQITDELYYLVPDESGPGIEVLATAVSKKDGKEYPIVYTVNHPAGRVSAITLGHDHDSHGHEAFQKILLNALKWSAE